MRDVQRYPRVKYPNSPRCSLKFSELLWHRCGVANVSLSDASLTRPAQSPDVAGLPRCSKGRTELFAALQESSTLRPEHDETMSCYGGNARRGDTNE